MSGGLFQETDLLAPPTDHEQQNGREPQTVSYNDIDLNRWLKGSYAVPVVEEDASATPGKREDDAS